MMLDILSPVYSEEKVLKDYNAKKSLLNAFLKKKQPTRIRRIFKPYYMHQYSYNVKAFNKNIDEVVWTLTEGITGISAIVDGELNTLSENIKHVDIARLDLTETEAEDNSSGIVEKSMYMKYKHYYKKSLLSCKVIYRSFYVFEFANGTSTMLDGDSYALK